VNDSVDWSSFQPFETKLAVIVLIVQTPWVRQKGKVSGSQPECHCTEKGGRNWGELEVIYLLLSKLLRGTERENHTSCKSSKQTKGQTKHNLHVGDNRWVCEWTLVWLMQWMNGLRFSQEQWMNEIYFPPWCRAGPYFVGVLLGFLLFRVNGRLKIHPVC